MKYGYDNTQLILPSSIGLHLADGRVIGNGRCKVGKEKKGESDYRRPCW